MEHLFACGVFIYEVLKILNAIVFLLLIAAAFWYLGSRLARWMMGD